MNKHYACSDLHGIYNLWEQIRDFCDDTDVIYFLGDAADRGKQGVDIIKELLADKRVKYIKGNHEDMLVKSFRDPSWIEFEKNWKENGGNPTLKHLKYKCTPQEKKDIIDKLKDLPLYDFYINKQGKTIFLSHAGLSPKENIEETKVTDWDLMWDRKHLIDIWIGDKNTYIVHGHTPVPLLWTCGIYTVGKNDKEPHFYSGGHKIDLDLGSFATGIVALMDLDTFEYKIFAAAPSNTALNER